MPERVPIMRPSSGVNPIVVSTLRPPSTAVIEQPFPRWQVTTFSDRKFFPSNWAARPAEY